LHHRSDDTSVKMFALALLSVPLGYTHDSSTTSGNQCMSRNDGQYILISTTSWKFHAGTAGATFRRKEFMMLVQ
jgi:hypothetical protein